jgi:transcriptional regulator with XRE-family HTH domain
MLATGVKGAVKLALRGTFYDPRVGTMGERMKALRLSRGLTLEDMGKVMEITAQALSQIENGITKNVRLDNFLRFCAHFDADPYFVVFGENKSAATGRFRKLKLP